MKEFLKRQLGHVLSGVIIWLPVAIIAMVGIWAFERIDGTGRDILNIASFGKSLPPGFGFFLIILLLYASGILLKGTRVRNLTAKIPVLGSLIGGNGDGRTMGLEKLLKLQPCLFLYSPTCPSYGFILSEEKVMLDGGETPFTLSNIYLPNAPAIVMGQVFSVRKETVIKLGNSPAEIVCLLLYASRSPESIKYLPWPGENKEEFEKRAKNFGLQPNIKAQE